MTRLGHTLGGSTSEGFGVTLAPVVGTLWVIIVTACLWSQGDDTLHGTVREGSGNLLHLGLVLFDGHLGNLE